MQSVGDLFYYPHTSLNGIVSAKVSVQLGSCRNLCSARLGCAGFDHSSNGDVCRLFVSVGGAEESQGQTAGTRSLVTGYHPPINQPAPPQPAEPPPQPDQPAQQAIAGTSPPATFRRFLNRDLDASAAWCANAPSAPS
ncbi:PAN domain-containing protein [Mesorhizobium sp. M0910]|uniref:PAN domain-containing protein n=1 Tax=Mesorhizobium sp. M0910 TaxID=2957025 RepID=UPI003339E4F3